MGGRGQHLGKAKHPVAGAPWTDVTDDEAGKEAWEALNVSPRAEGRGRGEHYLDDSTGV